MALFGLEAITKIIDGIKNGIPSWVSSFGNKDEKPAPDSGEHYDYFEEYCEDESWSSEPYDGYHDSDDCKYCDAYVPGDDYDDYENDNGSPYGNPQDYYDY